MRFEHEWKNTVHDAREFVMLFMFMGKFYQEHDVLLRVPDFYYDDFINAVCDYFKSMNMRTSVTPTAWWYATDILACVKEFSEVIQLPFTYDVLKTAVERIAI